MNRLILMLGLFVLSFGLLATEQVYQANVEGMVCAFCAYSVSQDVAGLPGVDADSVDVDLENGKVTFSSSAPAPQPQSSQESLYERRLKQLTETEPLFRQY